MLASEFITNSEAIVQHLHQLPAHDVIKNLTDRAEAINDKFGLINKQFDNYEKDINQYKDYLKGEMDKRESLRNVGDTNNQGSRE